MKLVFVLANNIDPNGMQISPKKIRGGGGGR